VLAGLTLSLIAKAISFQWGWLLCADIVQRSIMIIGVTPIFCFRLWEVLTLRQDGAGALQADLLWQARPCQPACAHHGRRGPDRLLAAL
jgi:hypothetical protein